MCSFISFCGLRLCRYQDPTKLDKFNISNFHYVKNNLKLADEGTVISKTIILASMLGSLIVLIPSYLATLVNFKNLLSMF